jgi:hypothetical protein
MKILDPETGEIVSYAKWMLPLEIKAKLDREFPWAELSLGELGELERLRRMGCGPDGNPAGLNAEMVEEVGKRMERARERLPVVGRICVSIVLLWRLLIFARLEKPTTKMPLFVFNSFYANYPLRLRLCQASRLMSFLSPFFFFVITFSPIPITSSHIHE